MTGAGLGSTPPHSSSDTVQDTGDRWDQMAAEHAANLKANGIKPSDGMAFFCTFKDGKYDKRLRMIPNAVVGDLATGSGKDTFFVNANYPNVRKITAIDTNKKTMIDLERNLTNRDLVPIPGKIELVTGKLNDAQLSEDSHDFFIVQKGFPNFESEEEIQETIKSLASILRPNGFVCVNFFTPEHGFAKTSPGMQFHNKEKIEILFREAHLEIEECELIEVKDKKLTLGRSVDLWSEFQVIAYKPDTTSKYMEASSVGDRLRQQLNTSRPNDSSPPTA